MTLLDPGMTTRFVGALAAAWIAGSVWSHATAEEAEPVVTAQIAEEGSNIAWGQAVIVLDKPIEEVLPIVVDYANYVQFMPNFTKSRVIAQRGTRNAGDGVHGGQRGQGCHHAVGPVEDR